MSQDRYSIERVKDRMWVVNDKTRQGQPVGGSSNENGARTIVSLLSRIGHRTKDEGAGQVSGQRAA
jgi:hypothetical protein